MKLLRKFCDFAPWDARGMAAHLTEMEEKGWRFRGTDWLGRWEYEACTPGAAAWAVAYAPSRRNWRLTPTEPERDLEYLCFDVCWRKIAALSMFHIYRNPDPGATPLESDELPRLDTLERSLNRPILFQALCWTSWSILILALLAWAASENLPRSLAIPALPGAILFLLWEIAASFIPWAMYRRWRRRARASAAAGLPCPAVTGWKQFSRFNHTAMAVLLLWIFSAGKLPLLLGYAAIFSAVALLRRLLPRRIPDEGRVEELWQTTLIVAVAAIVCLNLWSNSTDDSTQVESIPLMAQDLMDTTGMELRQFDYNDNEGPLASYHNYRQATSSGSGLDIQYTVFDAHLPILTKACEAHFLDSFQTIAARDGMTIIDATLPGAERVLFSTSPGDDQWLIFYPGRIVQLHTNWNLTPAQITAAAERLAP